tara:strand:+ start:2282 stop:3568 length:1287 start_codon:yes stop_codon:yes gene_type:complete
MSEWVTKPLSDLVAFHKGKKVDTWDYPAENRALYLGAGSLSGRHDGYASLAGSVQAKNSDVLMLWDGERSGLVSSGLEGVVASTVMRLTPAGDIDSRLLTYILSMNFEWIQNRRTGTGIPHVPKDLGRIFKCKYPVRIREQKNIANILLTLDEAIERTEQLIEKYQQIKAGLMHDLFTRGIGADGKLRPPRDQAPELYWESPIGWIPKDWECIKLEDLLDKVPNNLRSGPFGSALLKAELVEDGIPFLGIDNIYIEKFDDDFRRFVSERKFNELSKYAVRKGDVIITIMGTVGRAAVVPSSVERALSSKHLWTMTFDGNRVIPELICWQLNFSSWVKSWFRRETQGGIMDAIQSKTLRALRLPVPCFDEQKRIHERYVYLTSKLRQEELLVEKLRKQKSGLMHDLLTGNVSVSADLPVEPVSPEEGAA